MMRWLSFFLLCLLLCSELSLTSSNSNNNRPELVHPTTAEAIKIVKDKDHHYYLLYTKKGYSRIIPDNATLRVLLGSPPDNDNKLPSIPLIDESVLKHFPHEDRRLHSLADSNSTTALIEKILILSYPEFWEKTFELPDMFNPTIAYWLNKPLLAYREQMYEAPIAFEWFSFQRNNLIIDPEPNNYGLRRYYDYPEGMIAKFDFNQLSEDARLFPRRNGWMLVQYTCKASLFAPPKPCYVHLYLSPVTNKIEVTETIVLSNNPFDSVQPSQKNWIAIEWKDQLYFIQSINPFHLLLHNETDRVNHVGKTYLVKDRPAMELPWKEEYGLPIRGGTPTHLVKGLSSLMKGNPHTNNNNNNNNPHENTKPFPDELLLAFFHSVRMENKTQTRTYFMGAMALCAHYPFHLFSMSAQPILLRRFYEGEWADTKIDYVMFPIGLFERPESEDGLEAEEIDVKDEKHPEEGEKNDQEQSANGPSEEHKRSIWVTFGHLDKHGAVAKFNLRGLLESMEIIGECGNEREHEH